MVETIGFIVSFLSLLYLFTRQNQGVQPRDHQDNNLDERELDDPFNAFLKSLEKDEEVRERPEPIRLPPPSPKKKEFAKKKHSLSLERGRQVNLNDERPFKGVEERKAQHPIRSHEEVSRHSTQPISALPGREKNENLSISRIESAVQRLGRRRDLLIYQEIMGKPKSLRNDTFPE